MKNFKWIWNNYINDFNFKHLIEYRRNRKFPEQTLKKISIKGKRNLFLSNLQIISHVITDHYIVF